MAPPKKFLEFAKVLEARIQHGDYLFGELPSERLLCEESGLSQMTVRKAINHLSNKGLLVRKDNGRVEANTSKEEYYGILVPSYSSTVYNLWINMIKRCFDKLDLKCCRMDFVHWDDPVINDALQNLNGLFVMPPREEIPPKISEKLRNSPTPVAVVTDDYSEYGLHSIVSPKYEHIPVLLDYIKSFGHKKIDYLNTEPLIPLDYKRMAQWSLWLKQNSCDGEFFNDPVKPYEHAQFKAREYILEKIESGEFNSTAIVCTTPGVAMGLQSALWSKGLIVGKDVSVATFNGEGMGQLFCPPLTSLEVPDMTPYIKRCLDWMRDPEKRWSGSLLISPDKPELFRGESIGICPGSTKSNTINEKHYVNV